MIARIAVLLAILCLAGYVLFRIWWKRKFTQQADILYDIYLQSKRRDWLARWSGKSRMKRLAYQPETRTGAADDGQEETGDGGRPPQPSHLRTLLGGHPTTRRYHRS